MSVNDPGSVKSSRRPSNASNGASNSGASNSGASNSGASNSPLNDVRKIRGFEDFNSRYPLPLERLASDIHVGSSPNDVKTFIKYIVSKDKSALNDRNAALLARACDAIRSLGHSGTLLDAPANIVNTLLDLGVDVNIPDKDGNTPLIHIVHSEDTALIHRLIKLGADLNAVNKKNQSALIDVCKSGSKGSINHEGYRQTLANNALLLIEKGADIYIIDTEGKNALAYAIDAYRIDNIIKADTFGHPYAATLWKDRTPFQSVVEALQEQMHISANQVNANHASGANWVPRSQRLDLFGKPLGISNAKRAASAKAKAKANINAKTNVAGTRREAHTKMSFEPVSVRMGGKRRTKRARRRSK